MKQNLTFAVILLAMLSMINAFPLHKRKAEFLQCIPVIVPLYVTSMTPDPIQAGKNVTLTISGDFTKHPITSKFKQFIDFSESFAILASFRQDICSDNSSSDIPKCPVTDYNVTTTIQAPAYFGDRISVTIWDEKYNSDYLSCVGAEIG